MIPVTVRELADLVGAEVLGLEDPTPDAAALDALVTGLVVDSRQVAAGSLFVALVGERVDGHDYVATAFAQGAVAALVARPPSGSVGGPCLVVGDPLAAAGRVARNQVDAGVRGGLRVAAITGSAGKTSTKDLLAHLLEGTGPTVAPVGNLNNEIGVPLTVCRIEEATRFLVVEMGARGIGHIAYLCTITPPRVAAVLNVGTAHVGEFGGRDQIAVAKGEIVEALPADGTAVLTADDPLVWAMRGRTAARVLATSVSDEPEAGDAIWATDIRSDALGRCAFTLHEKWGGEPGEPVRVQLGLSGRHQVANAVAAAALARALGVPAGVIADRLPTARPRSRWRMELTERADGVLIVNDAYNANPESMRAALDTVGAVVADRAGVGAVGWAVLGDMLELGGSAAAEHRSLGGYAVRHGLTRVIAIGSFADEVVAGARAGGTAVSAVSATDSDDAVRRVLADLAPGDVVLVKASRGLALDTVAAAIAAADPVGPVADPGTEHSEDSA
ncbi:MAG TPA: UDP-N-acetylmuramoyl-tripeptide--D-alanyl-D-alanine ligase [Candidatus Nanopelagicales bacterium]|nr:UDP-N-acetylmuramoyl-tripeptide--D-alanyl-D-alanine ligase [Candidatus Nanopelagicales bacterium]